jgi:hypothetical protein
MNPENQNTRREPGAGKSDSWTTRSESQAGQPGNNKAYEERRNAAACFRNQRKTEDWHPAYRGVMVVEGLKDGDKLWVDVHVRTSRRGEKYISVVLKPQEKRS